MKTAFRRTAYGGGPRRSSRTCRRDKARVGYRNADLLAGYGRKLGLETFAAKGCGNDAT